MKTVLVTKAELRNADFGDPVEFSNEEGDLLECWLDETSHSWNNGFKIMVNGKLIAVRKTFNSFNKKLNKLISDLNLTKEA